MRMARPARAIARYLQAHIEAQYTHVRIQYRTPTQLGLLERVAVQLPKWQGWAKAAKEKLHAMVAGAHLPISSAALSSGAVA